MTALKIIGGGEKKRGGREGWKGRKSYEGVRAWRKEGSTEGRKVKKHWRMDRSKKKTNEVKEKGEEKAVRVTEEQQGGG